MRHCHVCNQHVESNEFPLHLQDHRINDNGSIKCENCDKRFRGSYELNIHKSIEHEGHRYSCKHCGKEYRSSSGLAYHIKSRHLLLNERLKCSRCESSFPTNQKLKLHERRTHQIKKLACNYCKNEFVYDWIFKKHQQRCKAKPGQGRNIFLCCNCNKRFNKRSYVRQHEKSCLKKKSMVVHNVLRSLIIVRV